MTATTRTALVFPGQGSQRPGMLADVPETDALPRLLDAAEALSGLELRVIESTGSAQALSDTRVAQPLLYLTGWAWGQALLDSGLEPFAVAGHSLGELTALATAGVFSVEAGLELVIERSRLMASAAASSPGGMVAIIGLPRAVVDLAVGTIDGVWVANDNAPLQVVITGTVKGIERAAAALTEAGARRVVPLDVAGAFHSPLMQTAASAFATILVETEFKNADVPVLQNADPTPTLDAAIIRERLMAQITGPVRWTETVAALLAEGPCTIVEAGPGNVLSGLHKRTEGVTALSVSASSIEAILTEVS